MENEGFYSKFESLPVEAQKQVLAFVDFLKKRYEPKSRKARETKPIANNKFVGIWKDREDLKDSSLWVKNLRKKEWGEVGR